MKTKNRTFIAICALGFIGLMNINAVTDNKKVGINDKTEMLSYTPEMTAEATVYSAQEFTDFDINNEIISYAINANSAEVNLLSDDAIQYNAKAFSTVDIDNEIEGNDINQILPEENVMNDQVKYSANTFSDIDFANEIKNRQ